MITARSVAVKVLCEIERKGSYSNIAADFAINNASLDRKDASFMSMLVYGVLQRKITIDFVIAQYASNKLSKIHPFVLNCLRIGVYQILFMDRVPESAAVNESVKIVNLSKQKYASGFTNALLRKVVLNKNEIIDLIENASIDIKYSCPKSICDELINQYSLSDASGFLKESVLTPSLYARINTLKINPQELFDKLSTKNINCINAAVEGSILIQNAGNIETLDEFNDGLFYIQDNASQIALSKLNIKPGMNILDVCSAPGGKSFTCAMYLKGSGSITSCDIYEKRVGLIKSGAERLGIDNLNATVNDALVYNEHLGEFDIVISDVPCSGLGVIRRKPEIKYRDLSQYDDLFEIQLGILNTSSKYVLNGGSLMYSTCTVRKQENEEVIKAFLTDNPNFKVVAEETLMPHTHGSDGFYYCIMKRVC